MTDQRGRVLWLTVRGQELMTTIKQLHAEIEADWASELGEGRYRILRSALHHLAQQHSNGVQS